MGWRLRVAKLAVFGRVPFGDALRRLKRQWFGYPPDAGNLRNTIRDHREMLDQLAAMGRSVRGATVLEIGTGWFPTVPLLLAQGGASRVLMSDLNPHLDAVTFRATLDFLRREVDGFRDLPADAVLADFPLTYLAPLDLASIAPGSLDYVVSRTVLEHIPEPDLRQLMAALRDKLAPDGLMVHCVDHSDHLEHADRSLSKVQFLTWSDRRHQLINRLTGEGENRLRHSDYLRLFSELGFQTVYEKGDVHQPTLQQVPRLQLAPQFRGRPAEELATLRSIYIVARADAAAALRHAA